MVQLSSPPVEMIPVQKGPSPEKNSALKTEDNGFRTAYKEQKEIHESRDAGKNTRTAETVSHKKQKVLQGDTEKAKKNDGETSSSSAASESRSAEKATQSRVKNSGLKLVKSDTDTKTLKLAGPGIEETDKETKTVSLNQEALSLIAGAEPGDESAVEVNDVKAEASALAETVEKLIAADSDEQKTLSDSASQAIKTASIIVQQNITGKEDVKENDKDSKSRFLQKSDKKSSELKITVDDRRTAKEGTPILKEVESGSSSNKLTLELVPSDDVTSAMPQGEQADTGKTFSLMSAEEQKGAALLDRQLQDKGTQELSKNIRFVLKDNKEGEIKLILKPEALGKVRINLNLSENNIVGKIIVENNSVRQAFMNNLADLTKALEDSGFSSASLDVSVGGGQTQGGSQYREEAPVFFTGNALDDMDGQIPVVYEDGVNLSQINLVV